MPVFIATDTSLSPEDNLELGEAIPQNINTTIDITARDSAVISTYFMVSPHFSFPHQKRIPMSVRRPRTNAGQFMLHHAVTVERPRLRKQPAKIAVVPPL